MENLLYTSASSDSLLTFIAQQRKYYKITIDFKDYVKYFDAQDRLIDHYVLNNVYVKHTQISPIFEVIKKTTNYNVVKVIIPQFTIYFPQYNNIKYTFLENSINLMLEKTNYTLEYDDVSQFFDNGINNYLQRTVASILSKKFSSANGRTLLCNDYKINIFSNYFSILEG